MKRLGPIRVVLEAALRDELASPRKVQAAVAALSKLEKSLGRAESVRRHARQLFVDGQLDKCPSTAASDEYKLWRLVKRSGE